MSEIRAQDKCLARPELLEGGAAGPAKRYLVWFSTGDKLPTTYWPVTELSWFMARPGFRRESRKATGVGPLQTPDEAGRVVRPSGG